MTQLLNRPFMAACLVVIWLLLTSFSLPQLVLGMIVAWIAIAASEPLDLPQVRIRRFRPIIGLSWKVFTDIIRSNIGVARIVLAGPEVAHKSSGFFHIDLTLRDKGALALLGIIATGTPGTVWIDFDTETGRLMLHVLDLRQPDRLLRDFMTYERLLKEIFE
ncbi:MAG: Na+/H+ antiporter subunit E [Paracoccus sp. (in: a-proteobacteria)]|nr:Na+/H+ antiporter subunit E [Paracoccus sp. (in: a-proteobacteria)]